jgi:hypothetical protein
MLIKMLKKKKNQRKDLVIPLLRITYSPKVKAPGDTGNCAGGFGHLNEVRH